MSRKELYEAGRGARRGRGYWKGDCEDLTVNILGEGHSCMERTVNMPTIVVTLDVSRVSGWLKSDANCAEWKGRQ